MPDWVAEQIDMDDYVDYLKAPIGTWDGKTYRISIDGDTHTFAYRTDYYADQALKDAWAAEGHAGEWAPPTTWEQVNEQSKFLAGKTDPLTGLDAYGIIDPLKYSWGGFGFYFLEDRAVAYSKHPDSPAWLFDPETMKPLVNNPGWVQAIQDVIDLMDTAGAYPPDQINADPNATAFSAVPRRHRRAGHVVGRRGLERPHVRHARSWATSSASTSTPARPRLQLADGRMGGDARTGLPTTPTSAGASTSPTASSDDELKRKCAWSAAAHLGGKDLSLWMAAYPSGFQPYRNSHFNYRRVGGRGLRPGLHRGLPLVERRQLQPPERGERAAHPGHLPVLLASRGRAREGPRQRRHRPGDRRQHRGGLGGDHRPDRSGEPDRALQGVARDCE